MDKDNEGKYQNVPVEGLTCPRCKGTEFFIIEEGETVCLTKQTNGIPCWYHLNVYKAKVKVPPYICKVCGSPELVPSPSNVRYCREHYKEWRHNEYLKRKAKLKAKGLNSDGSLPIAVRELKERTIAERNSRGGVSGEQRLTWGGVWQVN